MKEFSSSELSRILRVRILELALKVGKNGSHVGGALSIVDLLVILYKYILKFNLEDKLNYNRDRFILSKGHSANALFGILEIFEYMSNEISQRLV